MSHMRVLVTVLILVSLTVLATTTTVGLTTGKPSIPHTKTTSTLLLTKANAYKDGIARGIGENSTIKNTRDQITTTRSGSDRNQKTQCQCTVFYLCDSKDVATTSTGEECQNDQVCCLHPIPEVISVNSPKQTLQECGVRQPSVNNKIMGSENLAQTSFGEFPWMALILNSEIELNGSGSGNAVVCGASLLSRSMVLTAAHCVSKFRPEELRIRVGEYNILQNISEPMPYQERTVLKIIVHPEFKTQELFNDIALVKVSKDFVLTHHIVPICIPFINSEFVDPGSYDPNNCLATGWGKNAFKKGNFQTTLKKIDVAIIGQKECENRLKTTKLGQKFKLHPSFICAGGEPGSDTCEGDGGGPLVCASRKNETKYVQVGIVSWGIGCGSDVPAVHASLYANKKWLTEEYNINSVY